MQSAREQSIRQKIGSIFRSSHPRSNPPPQKSHEDHLNQEQNPFITEDVLRVRRCVCVCVCVCACAAVVFMVTVCVCVGAGSQCVCESEGPCNERAARCCHCKEIGGSN